MNMLQQLMPALRMTALLTVLTGVVYPGAVTGVCQLLFHKKADGSLVARNGQNSRFGAHRTELYAT
jgi:K+-transporting ATPase ATPase C chain